MSLGQGLGGGGRTEEGERWDGCGCGWGWDGMGKRVSSKERKCRVGCGGRKELTVKVQVLAEGEGQTAARRRGVYSTCCTRVWSRLSEVKETSMDPWDPSWGTIGMASAPRKSPTPSSSDGGRAGTLCMLLGYSLEGSCQAQAVYASQGSIKELPRQKKRRHPAKTSQAHTPTPDVRARFPKRWENLEQFDLVAICTAQARQTQAQATAQADSGFKPCC